MFDVRSVKAYIFVCCQICESIQSIQHVRNVNASEVVEQFFKRDVPIIVEDGLRDWDDVILQSPKAVADVSSTVLSLSLSQ